MQTHVNRTLKVQISILFSLKMGILSLLSPVFADGTVQCNVGTGSQSTECGIDATASSTNATTLGFQSKAMTSQSTAIGVDSDASGGDSTSLGYNSITRGAESIAIGSSSTARGDFAIAIGSQSISNSWGKISIGQSAGKNNLLPVNDSRASIALGYLSNIGESSAGAIAIGGDSDDPDAKGAESVAPGAIAIGMDVFNDVPNSMLINVPLRIEGDDDKLLVLKNQVNSNATRRLLKMVNSGPVGFEMLDTDLGEVWQFRTDNAGKFIANKQGDNGAEFSIDGDGNGRFLGEVRAAGVLLDSSRASKTDIKPIKPAEVMAKLEQVEIAEWRYKKADKNDRHISPMAEDFYALFKFGRDGKSINPNDLASVAIIAAKELQAENTLLKEQLKAQNIKFQKRLASLEKLITNTVLSRNSLPNSGDKVVLVKNQY